MSNCLECGQSFVFFVSILFDDFAPITDDTNKIAQSPVSEFSIKFSEAFLSCVFMVHCRPM